MYVYNVKHWLLYVRLSSEKFHFVVGVKPILGHAKNLRVFDTFLKENPCFILSPVTIPEACVQCQIV
jgi:hypothetical protein